jgi:hypothetical protein
MALVLLVCSVRRGAEHTRKNAPSKAARGFGAGKRRGLEETPIVGAAPSLDDIIAYTPVPPSARRAVPDETPR